MKKIKKGAVVFVGAANPETIRMIGAIQRSQPDFSVAGFLDNDLKKKNTDFFGYPVFGGMECVSELVKREVVFVNLITGNLHARYAISLEIARAGGVFTNFIHPNVDLTMTAVGLGNYIQESTIIQAGVSIGNNSSIHMATLIGHESAIGNSVFIAHGVSVSGCCYIGDGTFIGTNSTILPRISIGKWATIGAGTVVTKDVPDYSVVVGNPGRVIKVNEQLFFDGEILSEQR
jgi:sugar O-acyltransferase (sialic acid O-acetyltransferase NeuD family)